TMTHYARWLFGCAQREVPRGSTNDDGYWFELMGKIQYSRQAAIGFLGWDGTGDVRSWFNATNAARALDNSWLDVWSAEGGSGGAFDIYTAYDYPVDIRVVRLSLDLQNSTADSLVIRMYSVSWGMEVLMVRYMEAANITKKGLQSFMEDFYLNASVSPSMSNITCRATCSYDLIAWEDQNPAVWSGAWMLEMMHIDRCGNTPPHIIYDSPYTGIDPDETDWLRPSYSPWTTNYCNNVSYWRAPLNNSLAANEKMIFKLPQNDVLGIKPGRGTSDNLDASKLTELKSNLYWGRMVLGSWNWPNQTVRDSYDKASKTVTLQGPAVYPNESQPLDSTVLLHGVPMLVFDVQRATSYQVSVSGPLVPPTKNSVTVTIKNHTGATVTDWNGTVDLSSTDVAAVFDEISHVFSPSDGGTWRTNVTFVSPGWNLCVNATDRGFSPLNLKDAITGSWMGPIIPNNPPTASFTITPGNGDLSTIFIVNASESFDPEDGYNLQYRWDWEADGTYDTVWSTNKTAQHQYPLEGNYTIRLEVKDMWDLTDTEEKLVTVIIPEFASIALVIALTALMFIIFSRKRRG
ncbi:MAG: PKD domain-containing protein, partial [Thermoplasmata archaeon]|nr:PKD domain-containing protein [Thermoplasmata archaeon]